MIDFQSLDLLYCRALAALNHARQTRQLEEYEYRYLLQSFRQAQHPVAFYTLCSDLIKQFRRPIADA